MSLPQPSPRKPEQAQPEVLVTATQASRRTRRAFLAFGAAGLAGAAGWTWLRSRSDAAGIPWPFRKAHEFNEQVGRLLFGPTRLAPEFPTSAAREPRPNGAIGQPSAVKPDFTITIDWPDAVPQVRTLPELFKGLTRCEQTTEFKCIEGWSTVVTWGGYRFSDVAKAQGWPLDAWACVGLTTANENYYVGLDMPSALHPQTFLCDSMNGEPLTEAHGAPLRLIIPVKYGIKNIKWISRIRLQNDRPADYWAERGYDWYSGL